MTSLLKYQSNEDFYKEIDEHIAETQQLMSKRQLHIVQVIRAILKTKQIGAMEIAKDANLVFTPDFDKQILEVGYEPFCKHLSAIAIRHNFVFGVSAKDIEKNYSYEFLDRNNVATYVQAPPEIIRVKSGTYNLLTKKVGKEITNELGQEYYFPTVQNYDVLPLNQVNQKMLKLIQKLFDDWSEKDKDRLKFLKMNVLSALMGKGFKRYIIIQASGGNGKSTYLNMIKNIIGKSQYTPFNLQDLENNSAMTSINPSQLALIGDDLAARYVLSPMSLHRFKQLVTGAAMLIDRKYLSAVPVYMNGLKIQATNEFPRFMETGDMILDRTIVFKWVDTNYRKDHNQQEQIEKQFGKSLDKLVGDPETETYDYDFYTALVSWIVSTTELPTDKDYYHFAELLRADTEDAFDSSKDLLEEYFTELLESGTFEYQYIVTSAIYYGYRQYLYANNPAAKPMSIKPFINRLKEFITKHVTADFDYDRMRLKSLLYSECNVREFTEGQDLHSISRLSQYEWVNMRSQVIVINQNTHPLSKYSKTEQMMIINELIAISGLTENDFYILTKSEFERLLKKHKSEITLLNT
jgi:phage/plasmid primase, P4 family, C-terminal domain protein